MTHEPMLNVREKAPLVIMGVLIIAHVIRLVLPETILGIIQPWLVLSPVDLEAISLPQKLISLPGHSLLHADFTHLLMNSFMIAAFGIVTIQGLRADIRLRPHILSPVQKFFIIFLLRRVPMGVVVIIRAIWVCDWRVRRRLRFVRGYGLCDWWP